MSVGKYVPFTIMQNGIIFLDTWIFGRNGYLHFMLTAVWLQ